MSWPTIGAWFLAPRTSDEFHSLLRGAAADGLWLLWSDDGLTVQRMYPGLTYLAWPRQIMLVPAAKEIR